RDELHAVVRLGADLADEEVPGGQEDLDVLRDRAGRGGGAAAVQGDLDDVGGLERGGLAAQVDGGDDELLAVGREGDLLGVDGGVARGDDGGPSGTRLGREEGQQEQ